MLPKMRFPQSLLQFISLLLYFAIRSSGQSATSLFVPVEYPLNTFSASVVSNVSSRAYLSECVWPHSANPTCSWTGCISGHLRFRLRH